MRLVYNNIIEPKYQYHTDSDENDTTIGSPTLPTTDLTPVSYTHLRAHETVLDR